MKHRKNNKKSAIRVISMAVVVLILVSMLLMFTGCSETGAGEGKSTTRAIIILPSGEKIEGEVESWYECSNGMIRVTVDNVTYTVHGVNVARISE